MQSYLKLKPLAVLISALTLVACGDAETNIVEKDPIEVPDDDHDHNDDHDHGDGYLIDSAGRLVVLSAASNHADVYDLDEISLLKTFSLDSELPALSASAGYRYAMLNYRSADKVNFIDGGLFREDHGDHLHDFEQDPALTDYEVTGSRPTHIVNHDGQTAIFFDGNSETGENAAVIVLTDADISGESSDLATLEYSINMHGVAKPAGDMLVSTVRRSDDENTSNAKVLPDQVAVYHRHDDHFHQEHVFTELCPDLHGAGQQEHHYIFGCSDGVLVAVAEDESFSAVKIDNIDAVGDLRIGTVYAHHDASTAIGVASAHGGGPAVLVTLDAENAQMSEIDWQPLTDATPVAYAFSHDGEHFLILDNQAQLTFLSEQSEGEQNKWVFDERISISDEDVSQMPEGYGFKMTVAQNSDMVYVADPIAQHIIAVDLHDKTTEEVVELNYAPAAITWLGIAEEEEHDHDH
ncbi:hypothetical protein [Gayadomonas joobiniege]|uniref:hypothetical protein n=1 Tax=Gayadomonas joobiniege TaxID=1234606 RepID=UPI000374C15D|nr:hypothetical protein [Gayadomonas joobiniege]